VTNVEEPAVRITLGTIYGKLLEMDSKLGPLPDEVSDHEVRIRAIEKYLWIWIGASGVLGAGASQLISFIINR
jgi:hypothetical protein